MCGQPLQVMDTENGFLQASDEMAKEVQEGWHKMMEGYVTLQRALSDVEAAREQQNALAGLMRYSKILTASVLAHIARYRNVRRKPATEDIPWSLEQPVPPAARFTYEEPSEPMPFMGNTVSEEQALLRSMVGNLGTELTKEVRDRSIAQSVDASLAAVATASRRDTELSYALKNRLKELDVPYTDIERQKAAIADITAANTALKERSDRMRADCLKLGSDKFTLLGDKSLMITKIKDLEKQVHSLTEDNRKYRKLASLRHKVPLRAKEGKDKAKGMITVGGIEMEPEVVQWLREMYISLCAEAEQQQQPEGTAEPAKTEFAEYVKDLRADKPAEVG